MISFILFYLVGIPISVLLHELGHALGILAATKENARVYLGPMGDNNKENFRIGRIHFHIKWAFSGFCAVNNRSDFTRSQNIVFLAGGPIATLLLIISAYLLGTTLSHDGTRNFLNGIFFANLSLFIFTSIPMIYPKWWKPYAGRPSDGYQIFAELKAKDEMKT